MKKFLFDCGTRDTTASIGIFTLRVLIGLMVLIGHGIPKIMHFAARKDSFYVPDVFPLSWMSPQVSLASCIFAEVIAAAFIIIGFATRPAAFILGFSMVVATFGHGGNLPWFPNPPAVMGSKELAVLYLIPMIAIILTGAGNYSLDHLLYKSTKRRRW